MDWNKSLAMHPQLRVIGPKSEDLVVSFCLGDGETLPQFHLRAPQGQSEKIMLKYETGQINNLTDKYIIELSKMKHLQCYMTTFEIEYRNSELLPQINQLSTMLHSTTEEVFETLETEDIDISTAHSMIDSIVNRNFGNTFHHQNGPNQGQRVHKNTSQQYQFISYQIKSTSSIPYLK